VSDQEDGRTEFLNPYPKVTQGICCAEEFIRNSAVTLVVEVSSANHLSNDLSSCL
jgi:hypothetical protein